MFSIKNYSPKTISLLEKFIRENKLEITLTKDNSSENIINIKIVDNINFNDFLFENINLYLMPNYSFLYLSNIEKLIRYSELEIYTAVLEDLKLMFRIQDGYSTEVERTEMFNQYKETPELNIYKTVAEEIRTIIQRAVSQKDIVKLLNFKRSFILILEKNKL